MYLFCNAVLKAVPNTMHNYHDLVLAAHIKDNSKSCVLHCFADDKDSFHRAHISLIASHIHIRINFSKFVKLIYVIKYVRGITLIGGNCQTVDRNPVLLK